MMEEYKITVKTSYNKDRIEQWIEPSVPYFSTKSIVKDVMDLKEDGIRTALINLGWTPPLEVE